MKTILLVDDDETLRGLVARVLTTAGHRVIQAGNETDALGMTRAFTPDLVIVDAILPDGDGLRICRTLRERPESRHVPVMMMSGQALPPARENDGPDAFFMKPFRLADIASRTAQLLA